MWAASLPSWERPRVNFVLRCLNPLWCPQRTVLLNGQICRQQTYCILVLVQAQGMDIVLNLTDQHFFTPYVYPPSWCEDFWLRQIISLYLVALLGGVSLYLSVATLNFYTIFDRRLLRHPLILKNQIRLEMQVTLLSSPLMALPTAVLFWFEVQGHSQLYDSLAEGPRGCFQVVRDVVGFLFFTDMCIYWIHRGLHHPRVYKYLHKLHHKWKVPTPFASHAFHPVDGFLQSCPYHIYPFLFPLNKIVYLGMFVFVNFWTVSIHDANYRVPDLLKPFINGSAHHTDHHLFFDYNYGQYFTLWDRIGNSFREPSAFQGKAVADEVPPIKEDWTWLPCKPDGTEAQTRSSQKSTVNTNCVKEIIS